MSHEGASIAVSIVLHSFIGIPARGSTRKDQRDKEIYRFGEHIGQSFVVIGGVVAPVAYRRGFQPW